MRQVTWGINLKCNLNCFYCYQKKNVKGYEIPLDKIREEFKKIGQIECFSITGGEPLLVKDLAKIVNIVDAVRTTIFSNMLLLTQDFLDKLGNKKITFSTTYHYDSGVDVNEFIDKIKLADKRFHTRIVSVLHPKLSKTFVRNLSNKFKKENKTLIWKAFIGSYNNERYPNEDYMDKYKEFWWKDMQPLLDSKCQLSWKGRLCRAGKDLIYIACNGDVFRCVSSKIWGKPLGNIYKGNPGILTEPKICDYDVCKCFYQGQRYAI